LRLREVSGFGPKRLHYWLKRNLQIEIAISTIAKYLHKHKRTKKHLKREHRKSFDWKSLPLFSALQVDTKEIIDSKVFTQEEKWLYRRLGLPLYQFTAIFPRTRARFISFSFQNTKRASLNFLEYVFSHLDSHGAPFEETISFSHRDPVRTDRLGNRVRGFPDQECEAISPRPPSTQVGGNPSLHPPPYQKGEAGG